MSTWAPTQWITGAIYTGLRQPAREADNSPKSTAEVNDDISDSSLACMKCPAATVTLPSMSHLESKKSATIVEAKNVFVCKFANNLRPICTVYSKFSSRDTEVIFRASFDEPLFRSAGNLLSL